MLRHLTFVIVLPLCAQQASPPPGAHPMPEPKNLQVLKIPNTELMPTMRAYSASLGVRCNLCHVQGDFASDEKHEKQVARMMISMTQDINSKFGDGKTHVGCFTCHRGSTEPVVAPPPQAAPAPPPPAPKP